MRLLELFITETTEEDRAIISLSSTVYRYLQKYTDYLDPNNPEPVDIGKIGELVNTPLEALGDINIHLQSDKGIRERIAQEAKDAGKKHEDDPDRVTYGIWYNYIPAIVLNSDYLDSKRLQSILTHELRHALDDFKSDGKANKDDTRYTIPKKKEHRKDDPYADEDYPYIAQPAEINARFAQLLGGVVDAIGTWSDVSPEELRRRSLFALKKGLNAYKIAKLFPEKEKSRDYKRLIKRAVDMIDKEIAHKISTDSDV